MKQSDAPFGLPQYLGVCFAFCVGLVQICSNHFKSALFARRQWTRCGYAAAAYDIRLDQRDDLCSRGGFYRLLDLCLGFLVFKLEFAFGSLSLADWF